ENEEQADDSMEKLQLDEEDEKNVSAEDLLGGKSLMMSDDSENEDISETIGRKIFAKARSLRMLDTDNEEEVKSEKPDEQITETNDVQGAPNSRKKISAIIDTDSEEEPQINKEKDQDEEPELVNPSKKAKKNKLIKKQQIDSDDESQMQHYQKENQRKPFIKDKKKKGKEKKERIGSGSDEETQKDQSEDEVSPANNKLKGLVDSESEPELSHLDESAGEQEVTPDESTDKHKKAKAMRASAKKALDGMQGIQSEQQRLHREAHIKVPYHQPKPRTLKEFLSRRTINAPLTTALAGGRPMHNRQPRKSIGLRMTQEELEAYAELMDARAKEATEFFKSESEPEEESDSDNEERVEIKDNSGFIDKVPDIAVNPDVSQQQGKELTNEAVEDEPLPSTSTAAARRFEENPFFENPERNDLKSATKICLFTEVVELPKLDMSTINTTPNSEPATPKISEAIRRLRIEKSSDVSPSLKGNANMVIDLETGDMFAKKPTGVDNLLQRLIKTREAKKHKTIEIVNILTTEHGKLEMSKVNIHLHEEEPVGKEPKPGAAYVKMQEQLKSRITKKRIENLRKRQADEDERMAEEEEEEYEPENKPNYAEVTINEDEEIVDEGTDEEDEEAEQVEEKSDPEEDSEKEENNTESELEPEMETQTTKKKSRLIKAFMDDSSDEDDLDLLQTPKPSGAAPISATQLQLSAHKLFNAESRKTASDEENELLDLCSGQFPQTQLIFAAAPSSLDTALISQIPITQFGGGAPEELESLCSGTFATQLLTQKDDQTESQLVVNKIVSSDEEEAKEEKPRCKKLTKKRQKLGFSDDEESGSDAEDEFEDEIGGEPLEEIPETFVDYDSEENEIVVEMTKKDRKLRAANFVDKEAELSESEWGSADEDEENLDAYDIELGDEDQFDREKMRSELGQIHARKMLDQDIRDVRKIKEMLFEDDNGAVRQRQFRWKNAENGFSLEDDQRPDNSETKDGSGDEENEHLWRKMRHEREQLLLEKGINAEDPSPLSTTAINTSSAVSSIRRLHIISSKKSTVEAKKNSPFLISKTVNCKQKMSTMRGSFLVRDQETLSKLAGFTKGSASGDVDGGAGTVSVKTAKAKNFVFATLTEEEHENQKRKAADLLNNSSETSVNFMKKPRLEPRRENCLIDQLL
ncbi:hypothetical protein KR009_009195, partial [Drosophila setifemur]